MNGLQKETKPTLVLVHGAFAESSSWDDVIRILEGQGYTAIAAANLLRSLSEDAEYVAGIVRSIKGPAVLVGHSYGGAVITGAARGQVNVRTLVYVAGFAPAEGENANELLQSDVMAATQRPVRDVALNEDFSSTPAWSTVPSWFVIAELDRNIPEALQHFMAERARAREITVVKGASHAVGVSHPAEVAQTVLRAAVGVA